ncbi:MAG TPA: hypothetical protein VF993_13530, partial [Myxococcales bacterium]
MEIAHVAEREPAEDGDLLEEAIPVLLGSNGGGRRHFSGRDPRAASQPLRPQAQPLGMAGLPGLVEECCEQLVQLDVGPARVVVAERVGHELRGVGDAVALDEDLRQ